MYVAVIKRGKEAISLRQDTTWSCITRASKDEAIDEAFRLIDKWHGDYVVEIGCLTEVAKKYHHYKLSKIKG